MTHGEQKTQFTLMIANLILFVTSRGYEIRFTGEHCNHMENSLHYEALAKDFEFVKDGRILTDTKDYEFAGIFWESMGGSWGGRFSNPDGCHFSSSRWGRK